MFLNCSSTNISIRGNGNRITFDGLPNHSGTDCNIYTSSLLVDIIVIIIACCILIACVRWCCVKKRKGRHFKAMTVNNQNLECHK